MNDNLKENSIGLGSTEPKMTKDPSGNCQYYFSSEHVRIWGERGVMPIELVSAFFEQMSKGYEQHIKMKEFKEKNPNASQEDLMHFLGIPRTLSPDESEKVMEEGRKAIKFQQFLEANWDSLLQSLEEDKNGGFFKNIEDEERFGIVRQITDSMTYLNRLLSASKLNHLYDNIYEAKGEIKLKNETEDGISLVFTFTAASKEDAESTLEEYKKIMIGKGLKIWMAHWGLANEYGRSEYSCPMIEVMKLLAEEDREAHFSVKEKQEHWAITKMLGMTKVIRQHNARKKGTNKIVTRWIEQPLLEILGGEKEAEAGDKYPQLMAVRVLVPYKNMPGFVPAIFHKATYKLPPTYAMLAFAIQNRASQMGHGNKDLKFDWKFLFELGNLERTAISNPGKAKADTRKKMDRIKDEKIISGWSEEPTGMQITPISQSLKFKDSTADEFQKKPT